MYGLAANEPHGRLFGPRNKSAASFAAIASIFSPCLLGYVPSNEIGLVQPLLEALCDTRI